MVFRALGAKVIATNCREDGAHINDNCGSLYPENLAKKVLKYKADAGFAFDGDSDRLIAVDETGAIQDGDKVVFVLAKDLKAKGLLRGNAVVGTSNTNMGIKEALEKDGIELLRVDIGDKYVIAKLIEKNLSLAKTSPVREMGYCQRFKSQKYLQNQKRNSLNLLRLICIHKV